MVDGIPVVVGASGLGGGCELPVGWNPGTVARGAGDMLQAASSAARISTLRFRTAILLIRFPRIAIVQKSDLILLAVASPGGPDVYGTASRWLEHRLHGKMHITVNCQRLFPSSKG